MDPRKVIADLHTHSTASDGKSSPTEVVAQAKSKKYKAVAITDHDTIAGLKEAVSAAENQGIALVPGVEISVCYKRPWFTGSLHCLLYFSYATFVDPGFSADLKDLLSKGGGQTLLLARISALNKLFGPQGTLDPIIKHELNVREVIASAEPDSSRNLAIALKQYHDLDDVTINRLINNTSPAYVPSGVEMSLIKPLADKYQMVKVLAHPAAGSVQLSRNYREVLPPFETVVSLIPELISFGLNGIEVYYPGHTPELIEALIKIADDNNLLVTGGSDFHNEKRRPMGTAGVTEEELEGLMERIKDFKT